MPSSAAAEGSGVVYSSKAMSCDNTEMPCGPSTKSVYRVSVMLNWLRLIPPAALNVMVIPPRTASSWKCQYGPNEVRMPFSPGMTFGGGDASVSCVVQSRLCQPQVI